MNMTHRAALRHDLRAWSRNVDLQALIRRNGTPLLVLQPERAAARYRALRSALPFVRFHYAVKALDHCAVLRAVHGATCPRSSERNPPTRSISLRTRSRTASG